MASHWGTAYVAIHMFRHAHTHNHTPSNIYNQLHSACNLHTHIWTPKHSSKLHGTFPHHACALISLKNPQPCYTPALGRIPMKDVDLECTHMLGSSVASRQHAVPRFQHAPCSPGDHNHSSIPMDSVHRPRYVRKQIRTNCGGVSAMFPSILLYTAQHRTESSCER